MPKRLTPKKTGSLFSRMKRIEVAFITYPWVSYCVIVVLFLAACHREPKPAYLVYVSNEGSGDMTVIDPGQPQAIATIPLGKRPRGIHAGSGFIFVALSGSPAAPPGVDESKLPPPDKSADG